VYGYSGLPFTAATTSYPFPPPLTCEIRYLAEVQKICHPAVQPSPSIGSREGDNTYAPPVDLRTTVRFTAWPTDCCLLNSMVHPPAVQSHGA
jgi:hypothetical protein